ncbi:MAG: DUF4167 domain-containing protein [Sphingobium phenoxybenzoativorans]
MINNRQAGRRNRGRNNNGRPNGQNRGGGDSGNRIDSRSRGNAAQLLEKYRNMARDAQLSGDRVNVEYYLQFADHYFRVLADNRARQEEQNPQRFRREESFDENGEDFDGSDDFGMDYMADRTPPQRQERADRQDQPRDNQRQDRQENGYRQDNGERHGNGRQDGQRQDYQPREQRADRGDQQDGRGNQRGDRNRNRNNRDRDYDRAPQDAAIAAAPVPAPVEAPASQPEFIPEQASVAAGDAAPKPRRGRRPKAEAAPEADVQEGLDLAVLPPAISRADNDSDGDEAPAPRKRGRPRRAPTAEAAE